MFLDARTIEPASDRATDLLIIGAGPAGITLAQELAGSGIDITVLESGGFDFDEDTQALYEGENVGLEYPMEAARLRYFGGSSNHWGGYCRPLDAIDFEKRDWVPHSGWPITRADLEPYYLRALPVCDLGPMDFSAGHMAAETGEPAPDFIAGRIGIKAFQFSPPTRFGEKYRDALANAGNIKVLLHANVTEILLSGDANSATGVEAMALGGERFTISAKRIVLAAGGIENPRILLASRKTVNTGIGNGNDLVGRFFMEHPHLSGFCDMVVASAKVLPSYVLERQRLEGVNFKAAFIPREEYLRREKLLNASFTVGLAKTYERGADLPNLQANQAAHLKVLAAAEGFMHPERATKGGELGAWLGVGSACEQTPNPDSRITLSSDRDATGMPRVKLDWRLTEQERRSIDSHIRALAMEFGAAGIGRGRLFIEEDGAWPDYVGGGNHHMGTTRMGDDPKQSVVDRDCRVHGLENLYIAGSSVFTTGGSANPTLTIVALALRLADHLKAQ